jgi:phage terminase large subunit-like protein
MENFFFSLEICIWTSRTTQQMRLLLQPLVSISSVLHDYLLEMMSDRNRTKYDNKTDTA